MDYFLHKSLPRWVSASVARNECSKCDNPIKKEDINGIGIKETSPGKSVLFVEYRCSECEYCARISFPSEKVKIEELCYIILEELQNKRRAEKSTKLPKSKNQKNEVISEKEVQSFIKDLNKIKTFDEFLKLIKAPVITEADHDED